MKMNDLVGFIVVYVAMCFSLTIFFIYFALLSDFFAYCLLFAPFYKDSLLFVLYYIIFSQVVAIDPHGGEFENESRNLVVLLFADTTNTILEIENTVQRLLEQKINGEIKIIIINDGKRDFSINAKKINPMTELETGKEHRALFSSGIFFDKMVYFLHYYDTIPNDKGNIVKTILSNGLILVENFESNFVLVTSSSLLFNTGCLNRMSNILLANPRIASVCGLDINYDSGSLYKRMTQGLVVNKIGKYAYQSSTTLAMFNIKHPSIVSKGIDLKCNTSLISHSERTWVVIDKYSYRVGKEFQPNIPIIENIGIIIDSKNWILILFSIIDIFLEITGMCRFLLFFIYISSDYITFSGFDDWLLWTTLVVCLLPILFFFTEVTKNSSKYLWLVAGWSLVYRMIVDILSIPKYFLFLYRFFKKTA